jgi:HEAT repeat protein
VNNLIDDPAYANEVKRLSKALDQWQLEHFDAGLLPESEIVKRAEEYGTTIYDFVRDPSAYDVKAYLEASSIALQQDAANLPTLYKNLTHADAGIRYWATVGCFNLQESAALDINTIGKTLDDESHHVRAMAAWILYRAGEKSAAQDCWNKMLRESSYASLKILNIIDWIGEGTSAYTDAIQACSFSHNGYVDKMKANLGVDAKPAQKKRKRKAA